MNNIDFDYLINTWKEQGILEWILEGRINLIWTGGEPTMRMSQKAIIGFLEYFNNGKMDDVAIWNDDLSAAEVTALYNSGIAFKPTSVF